MEALRILSTIYYFFKMMTARNLQLVLLFCIVGCLQSVDSADPTQTSSSTARGEVFQCPPAELCKCELDSRGRLKVACDFGEMVDPIPIRAMDPLTEVLIIGAPEEKHNSLTIGPIFQSLMKLEELKITRSQIPAIGKHSFWGLRLLRSLDLSVNNISALIESNFRGLVALEELRLDNNIIDSIPSAAFRHLSGLRRLWLKGNRLSGFVPRLFYGLHRLEELDLSYNPLNELDPEVFRDVRLLRTLRCIRCGLTYINSLLLHLLPDIVVLDLSENKFHYLDKNAFRDLQQLRHLYLDGNQITVVTSGVFTGHNLTTLSLARNKLIAVDPAAFAHSSISNLNLSNNKLQSLDPSLLLPLNRSLQRLKIGGNPLQVFHLWSSVLSPRVGLSQISELDLADIPIGRDPHFQVELFSYHRGLKILNISGTSLNFLPAEIVQSLPLLNELDISRNELSSLSDLTISALSTLQEFRKIHIHSNPWYCDACVIGPTIKWLDISPAGRHIKDRCRGFQSNAPSTIDSNHEPCPVCSTPTVVSGVELPRLDHVNLPSCNYPPSLIDSRGLASKVRFDLNADSGGSMLKPSSSFKNVIENPLFLSAVCGIGILMVAAVCAAVAVASRHAASYYTHEENIKKEIEESATEEDGSGESEIVGLFPMKAVESHSLKLSTKLNEKSNKMEVQELERLQSNKNNNGKAKCEPVRNSNRSGSVVSRGVRTSTPTTTAYPLSGDNQQHLPC